MSVQSVVLNYWSAASAGAPINSDETGKRPPSCEVKDGMFTQRIFGNPATEAEILEYSKIPEHAVKLVRPGEKSFTWYAHGDRIFGNDGLLAKRMENYEMRPQQLHMSHMIQRAVEMQRPAIIEGGVGVGKSFGYLATGMSMDKRMIVAAPTTALQMQLWTKDVPFLQSVFPNKSAALLMGKSNYFCMAEIYDAEEFEKTGKLVSKIENPVFEKWFTQSQTGIVQEWENELSIELQKLTVDEETVCKGCPFMEHCNYQNAKLAAQTADVLITNHSLVVLNALHPAASLLPVTDILVIDEAHQLPEYARNSAGDSFKESGLRRTIRLMEDTRIEMMKLFSKSILFDVESAESMLTEFMLEISNLYLGQKSEYTFTVPDSCHLEEGVRFANMISVFADHVWAYGRRVYDKVEQKYAGRADKLRRYADTIERFSRETIDGEVRYIEVKENQFFVKPFDVSAILSGIIKPASSPVGICAECKQSHGESVFVRGGIGYCEKCADALDCDDLEILSLTHYSEDYATSNHVTILTSATLASPDFSAFKTECGIESALEMVVGSPFDYRNNLLYYTVPNAPDASDSTYPDYVAETMLDVVEKSKGGAFLLFTSNAMLNHCVKSLKPKFEKMGLMVLQQGQYGKQQIVKLFKENGNAVLFATKTYWEGVDIQGAALRAIVIDKLPYEAPNPISTARSNALIKKLVMGGTDPDKAKWVPFDKISIPLMTKILKQGIGRGIRSQTDYATVAICDGRVTSKKLKNTIFKSVPPGRVTDSIGDVEAFYSRHNSILNAPSIVIFGELPF